MTVDLTEEEMRRALFGAEHAPAPDLPEPNPLRHIPDVVIVPPAPIAAPKKARKTFTPRVRVTLEVSNVFEGDTETYVHDADTISTLLAQQEAIKLAREKYRYVEVVSIKPLE